MSSPTKPTGPLRILTINGGSSSIKFALFEVGSDGKPQRVRGGAVERVGTRAAVLRIDGQSSERGLGAANLQTAIEAIGEALGAPEAPAAVAHRVVHGGASLVEPRRIDQSVLAELRKLAAIDPDHLPAEIELIEAVGKRYPLVPQIACFDTAFHHDLPTVAQTLAIPREWTSAGVRRFGFHGLSYQYLLDELGRVAGESARQGRVILAHLGSGASLAAVHTGKSIDTTMSFTPTAGLVMGTRCGDLDPGVLLYLMRSQSMSIQQVDELVNRQSGLAGISGGSSDMRDLLKRRETDANAAEAIDIFCYQAKKFIGAMAAALGGLDTLVFSAGIGEHIGSVRAQICQGLEFIGIELDPSANEAHAPLISRSGSRVAVRVIPTDEEITLARAAFEVLEI